MLSCFSFFTFYLISFSSSHSFNAFLFPTIIVTGLMNLGRLLRPSFDGDERALILESRKYAIHDPNYHDNSDYYVNNNNDDNNNTKERDIHVDRNKGKDRSSDGVIDNKVENDVKGERTYSVTCSYYRPVLIIRDEASKYGVRRACVLLGENGTYLRMC